jgi:hypothetical protein
MGFSTLYMKKSNSGKSWSDVSIIIITFTSSKTLAIEVNRICFILMQSHIVPEILFLSATPSNKTYVC